MKAEEEKLNAVISVKSGDLEGMHHPITSIISTDGKVIDITEDVDVAMNYALNIDEHFELSEADDKKLVRKIDLFLLPLMCILYCFQFMDKLSNSFSSILGLRTELDMVGDMYSWTGTAFYLGYLAFEFPAATLLQRFPVAKTVGTFITLWGVILALHSVPQYPGFVALRVLLGMLESSVTPAFVIITGQYYKKEEQFLRTALWFSCNGAGTILGSGAIAYGLVVSGDKYSLPAWKLIFVVTGVLTIALGIAVIIHIPDNPTKAWFLTEQDKKMIVQRIRTNQQGFGNNHFKKHQFVEALLDIKTWLFFLYGIASDIPNGGITNFGAILLSEDMGYSTKETMLMSMPGGAVELVGCTLFALFYKYSKLKSRMIWSIIGTGVSVVGMCMLAFGKSTKVQFAGYTMYSLNPIGFICLLSSISSNVAGHTKKVTVNAIFLIGYCVGNLIGPQTFLATEAPTYKTAKICIAAFGVLSLVILFAMLTCFWVDNKKKDAKRAKLSEFELQNNAESTAFADLTDKENPNFRYEY